MGAWLMGPVCVAAAIALEVFAVRGLRAAWLAHEPISGDHTDSIVYHRNLWTPGATELLGILALLVCSGVLFAMAFMIRTWPLWPALLLWLGAVAWDLWTWERVAASVKFVSWRRGWQHSARRVAVSDLREVSVVERHKGWLALPASARPTTVYLMLSKRDGKAVKLVRTGSWLGGERSVEDLANFVRMQMDVVADNRRRAAADKRSAARIAKQPVAPMHPASKVNPEALPFGNAG